MWIPNEKNEIPCFRMKILKLSPYFYPEQISSSHLDRDLCEAFCEAGFIQENYVPMPSRGISDEERNEYKDKKIEVLNDGAIVVHRFPMVKEGKNSIQRALKYVLTNIIQLHKGKKAKDIDVIFAGSTPPTQGVLCSLVKKKLSKQYGRKVPFVYNLQDIFPDSLVNAKMTSKGSMIWKIGRKIEDYTYRNADKIITISEDFKTNIMEKGVPEDKIVVIPNWVNTDSVFPIKREDNILFERFGLDRSKFYICYSGNLGHSQNLELIVDVAKTIKDTMPDVIFVFIGEGAAKEQFEKTIQDEKLDNIKVFPFQPYEDIVSVFSLGDVGLIISKPGIGGSSVPSKTWSIMAAERPILASFDKDSELSSLIEAVDCGIAVDPDDKEGFIKAIRLFRSNAFIEKKGKNGRMYLSSELDKDKCVKKYVDTLKSVVE